MVDARTVSLDPREASVWRHDGPWWVPLGRRPYAGAVALAALAVALVVVVALRYDLPIRDADGMLGPRMWLLIGVLSFFFALELAPRTFVRVRAGASPRAAFADALADRWNSRRLRAAVIGIGAFYLTYLSYRNLKSYVPFIAPQDLDAQLLAFEEGLFGGHPATFLHDLLGTGIAADVLSTTYLAYLGFIPVSLGAAFILAVNPMPGLWWVTALGLNWLLGALSYYLVPAMGPIYTAPELFTALPQTGTAALQDTLLAHRLEVLANPFATPEVQSIAAFASLHTSVTFTAALIAQLLGLPRPLRWGLWGFLGLTLIATTYFGWHYVVDDLAGLLIGLIAVAGGAAATGHWRVLREARRRA
jgi:hypothetical protein